MKSIRILGIDPGYAIVGFGIVDYDGRKFTPVEYGAVLTEAHTPFPQRLKDIHTDIEFIFDKYKPHCMAIEKLFSPQTRKQALMLHSQEELRCFRRQREIFPFRNIPLCR